MTDFPPIPNKSEDKPRQEPELSEQEKPSLEEAAEAVKIIDPLIEASSEKKANNKKPNIVLRFLGGFFGGIARPVFFFVSLGLTGVVIGALIIMGLFYYYSKDLPDSSSLANYNPAGMTRFYARDGQVIAEYAKQRRIYVAFDDIPQHVVHAFIAAEDQNFYSHSGVDPEGIARALFKNVTKYGNNDRSLVGGSTITQQVVKNFLLTNEKSLERKIKEAILALRITQTYTKDRILELYLNEIYLGLGAYGVAAASLEYFDKELHELDTEEVALLAGMPKAPSSYDPIKNPERALERRNYVIRRMFADGYINEAEFKRATEAEMKVDEEPLIARPKAPFFSEEVRRWVSKTYGSDKLYNESLFVKTTIDLAMQDKLDKALRNALIAYDRRHGYRGVLAHLDSLDGWEDALLQVEKDTPLFDDQRAAVVLEVHKDKAIIAVLEPEVDASELAAEDEGAVEEKATQHIISFTAMKWARPVRPSGSLGAIPRKPSDILTAKDVVLVSPLAADGYWQLDQIPKVSGAMVAMRPQTGEVLAMSGGYSFGESQFNRATQAKRQPGSSFKPFAYMAAMERGYTPSTIVVDEPIEISQGPGKPMWRPKNYGGKFIGPSTLRMGLEKSRNVMTVRLAQMVGLPRIKAIGERFGIYEDSPLNYSMVLGSHETTVMKLVTAYSMLVNGGLKVEPIMVKRVDDREGKTLYRSGKKRCTGCTLSDDSLKTKAPPRILDQRERVADPRVAYQMVSLLEGVVQRGTAVKAKKLGFPVAGKTGTTNDSRDAWFLGFTQDLVVGVYIGFDTPRGMGRRETGGKVALPAFIDFMKAEYTDYQPPEFIQPQGIVQVAVDRYTGVPPLPWQQAEGPTIIENFVTGGSIFIPGAEIDIAAPEVPEPESFVDYDAERDVYLRNNGNGQIQPRYDNPYSTKNDNQQRGYVPVQPASEPRWETPPWQRNGASQSAEPRRSINTTTSPAGGYSGNSSNLPPRHPSRAFEQRRRDALRQRRAPSQGTGGLY